MAVSLLKRSYYPIQVRTASPSGNGQKIRRTRFHSAAAAHRAAAARIEAGHTLDFIGYVTADKG